MRTNPSTRRSLLLACASMVAAATSMLVLTTFLSSRPAHALPAYAQQTGLACGQCHVNPAGGGPRTAFGRAFARNGHRLPGSRSRSYQHSDGGPGYGMGPGMMGGYGGGMGPGMMGGYGR